MSQLATAIAIYWLVCHLAPRDKSIKDDLGKIAADPLLLLPWYSARDRRITQTPHWPPFDTATRTCTSARWSLMMMARH